MNEGALELAGLFASAAISSSILPGGSELALGYLLTQERHAVSLLIGIATLGNTLGAMSSWLIGRVLPEREFSSKAGARALNLTRRFGAPALLFSWLPIIGDAACVAAGWLRIAWLPALVFIALGKFARYVAVWWLLDTVS